MTGKQIATRDVVIKVPGSKQPPAVYHVEERELFSNPPFYRTFIYDDADPFMFIDGKGYSDELIAEFVEVHKRARKQGEESGRIAYRNELLDKLGAEPRRGA